jgi:putative transposase
VVRVKYEDLYIKECPNVPALEHGLRDYFELYNYGRPHQSLAYRTPADVHCAIQRGSLIHLIFIVS